VSRCVIALIRAYQLFVSPALPPSCRFTPSCSQYAIDAYRQHGFWNGSRLSTRRLMRCAPWSHGGYDPVPMNHEGSTEPQLHACRELE
jgi:putative membrane protein insertion efficiency factor